LILHLCGNITQYAHASLGNEKDDRHRDLEFSAQSGFSKKELLGKITTVTEKAIQIIENIPETELLQNRKIPEFDHTGISVIIHITEHFSYHVGQIAFFKKCIKKLGHFKINEFHLEDHLGESFSA
jgi:hypothetical protein